MDTHHVSRRALLKGGGAALAGLTTLHARPAHSYDGEQEALASHDDRIDAEQTLGEPGDVVIPWLDQPPPSPIPANVGNLLVWEALESWITPANNFFFVNHFGPPANLDGTAWRVGIEGLVARPLSLSLADLRARARHEVTFTLECSGNTDPGLDFFIGGIGNARWAGTPLAPLLLEAGLSDDAIEVIFWGADSGTQVIRDNTGIIRAGQTGTVEPDADGGLDLTITEHFARSMSLRDALSRDNILCYEMNGDALPPEHGFPVRLIAPGWYGVANVKWLTRIEVVDQRYAGKFMARDYVSIREQQRNGETVWTFNTVRHDRIKSAPARVARRGSTYVVLGAAWGAPIVAVEVRVDDGPWLPATLLGPRGLRRRSRGLSWTFWTFNWMTPTPGAHAITSRAFDSAGNMQPAPDDPFLASKVTFWESNGQITRRVLIS